LVSKKSPVSRGKEKISLSLDLRAGVLNIIDFFKGMDAPSN